MSAERPPVLMGDGLLGQVLSMADAVALMAEALAASRAGALASPPRVSVPLDGAELVVTAGAAAAVDASITGFRAYVLPDPAPDADQVTIVWNRATGRVAALYVGRELGEWRTGALGGAAVVRMASPSASVLGVIGTGRQAWTQALGALAARPFARVVVHSRSEAGRDRFAERLAGWTAAGVAAVARAEEAAWEADVLITATDSAVPVLRAEWVRPGTHVNHVGPKRADACELPVELYDCAGVLATDAPAQLRALGRRSALWGRPCLRRMASLAELPDDASAGRPDALSLFHSLGLAGTEVLLAHRLAERLRHLPAGASDSYPFSNPTETRR